MEEDNTEVVECKGCFENKNKSEYYKKIDLKSGIRQPCKECIKEQGRVKRKEYSLLQKNIDIKDKVCCACKELKLVSEFKKRSDSPCGLSSDCFDCLKVKRHDHYERNADKVYHQVKAYRQANPEKSREWTAAWRKRNPNRSRELEKAYRKANRDKINTNNRERGKDPEVKKKLKLANAEYRKIPRNKERLKESRRKWGQKNKDKICYYTNKRRAMKLQATPPWADQDIIKSFYTESQYFSMEIDHIIPLTHPLVCGLHCEFNLQLLSRKDNAEKHNSFEICEHELPEYLGEEYHD